ncbi:hypothetical protein [Plantactinospora sp. GCM10030261]|uniref:TY-Chap domain-containing protein n=1 Tax=Plantactinospora sp. GCM10030261 TaxID=3273420 RepID=UPI0036100CB0
MSGEMDWADVEQRLADLTGRLSNGTVLQLRTAARPLDGCAVRLVQRPDALAARLTGDMSPDAGHERTLDDLGWRPPDAAHQTCWWLELPWPATAAGYRQFASGVVGAMREVGGLRRPADCAYELQMVDGTTQPLDLGMPDSEISHFARLSRGDARDRPSGLLRRVRVGHRYDDEALGRDGEWQATETLVLAELGALDDRVVPLTAEEADRVLAWWGDLTRAEARRRDRERDPDLPQLARSVDAELDSTGRPVVRTARLDASERGAVAAYLRNAPVVLVAWGFDPDPFDPRRPEVVPLDFHTDGEWVWSESLAYFAERYGIGPEPELLAHLARRRYQLPDVSEERIAKAVEVLGG